MSRRFGKAPSPGATVSWLVGLAGAAFLFPASGCETTPNPATGRPEVVLMSRDQEIAVDEREAAKVEVQLGLVQDEAMQAYVKQIGAALARNSPRKNIPYQFAVVEMEAPNAFALPGGHVYVSRGLLLLTNSEAELANVIGHEIGHVAARHAAQRDAHMKTLGIATLMGRLAGGGRGDEGESIGGADGQAAYGRNQEREADTVGMDLAAAAGIDPGGMGSFLRHLDSSARLAQGFSTPQTYFSSHPATPERIAETTTRAETLTWTPGFALARTREEYLERLDGMAVTRPTAEGVFVGNRFLHADLGISVRFPRGWTLENQNAFVVGVSPERDAIVLLQMAGEGDDPELVAQEDARRGDYRIGDGTPVRIGELAGYRARGKVQTPYGVVAGEVTYIAFDNRVYRLVGGVERGNLGRYEGALRKFARSFRRITAAERAEMTEVRLRVAVAQEGESLRDLGRRTGNEWDPNETAVANGLHVGQQLEPGSLVKIAVREPYDPAEGAPVPVADPPL